MPLHNLLTIRFIRRGLGGLPEENPALDDTLRIQKLGENNLRITYTERSVDGVICDTTLMTYQRFFHYVWRVLWLLSIDVDPFQNVQLMIPGYPMVLVPVTILNQNMASIMDILMTTCWQWPVSGSYVSVTDIQHSRSGSSSQSPLEAATTEFRV